jgi:hypothetical protein
MTQANSAATKTSAVERLGVAPRFPKVANYLKTYTLGAVNANWRSELIPELEEYGRGEDAALSANGKGTGYARAMQVLRLCANALQRHAVQAALGSRKPRPGGPAKPVTEAATRREFEKLVRNGKHVRGIWPQNIEQYFDAQDLDYIPAFAKELDEEVSEGEFKIVRHLLLAGHAPATVEAALLEYGPALVLRKGDRAGAYAVEMLQRAMSDSELKTWMAAQKAALHDAQAIAEGGGEWLDFWRRSVAYRYWALRMGRRGAWILDVANTAAFCLVLGWTEYAVPLFQQLAKDLIHGGSIAYDDKKKPYHNPRGIGDYDDKKKPYFQRRTQYFLIRMVADWQGIVLPSLPRQADDEPLFAALLKHWRSPDLDVLTPLLLAACDRHTHLVMVRKDSPDFETSGDLTYIPFEILAIFRLRQMLGLPNPQLDHPLMATPMGALPPITEPYHDEILDAVIAQARKEFAEV